MKYLPNEALVFRVEENAVSEPVFFLFSFSFFFVTKKEFDNF